MPRPKSEIDLDELEKLCAIQCTDQEIAPILGVSTRTIALPFHNNLPESDIDHVVHALAHMLERENIRRK